MPNSPLPDFQLGWLLYRAEQLEAAAEAFEHALARQDAHVPSLLALGIARGRQGAVEAANACFEKVLRLEPDSPDAGFGLGVGLANQSRFDEARRPLQDLVERHPDAALARAALAALASSDRTS
ncbi:Beta-barrel assembly-enhancing protease [compost metagenome]